MPPTASVPPTATRPNRVLVLCMPYDGHFNRLRPVIAELVAAGAHVEVHTVGSYAGEVRRIGARFVDLFAHGTVDEADGASDPPLVRLTSWTARHADRLIAAARRFDPGMIVCDDFALTARVLARAIDVPVTVARGHRTRQSRPGLMDYLLTDRQTVVSDVAVVAAARIEAIYGVPIESPLGVWAPADLGRDLVCEPPQFVTDSERREYPSELHVGSVLPSDAIRIRRRAPFPTGGSRRLYVGFGTYVWHHWPARALRIVQAISDAVSRMPGWSALVTLGGAARTAGIAGLETDSVRIRPRVDQWAALAGADAFVTHHGLNSTHEAIYAQVPMLSCPFTVDQPSRAQVSQGADLAIPLCPHDSELTSDVVERALERLDEERDRLVDGLVRARGWEDAVISRRPETIQELLSQP